MGLFGRGLRFTVRRSAVGAGEARGSSRRARTGPHRFRQVEDAAAGVSGRGHAAHAPGAPGRPRRRLPTVPTLAFGGVAGLLRSDFAANFDNRNLRRPNWTAAGAVLLALALLCPSPAFGQTAGLFTPVDSRPSVLATLPEGTLRSRFVKVDRQQLGRVRAVVAALPRAHDRIEVSRERAIETARASGASLRLNLFDDVSVTAIVEWTEPTFSGGYSLSGSMLEDPLGSMTFVVNGDRVAGSVETGGQSYRFRSVGNGLYSISEVKEPPLRCGVDDLSHEVDHDH